jgi:hypothetical protein
MMEPSPTGRLSLVAPVLVQLGIAMTGLTAIIFTPPAQGRMLLVPLTASAEARLPSAALGHDALLLGSGPLPGSLVVIEDRPNLLWSMVRIGVLPIAASPAGCGPLDTGASRT